MDLDPPTPWIRYHLAGLSPNAASLKVEQLKSLSPVP